MIDKILFIIYAIFAAAFTIWVVVDEIIQQRRVDKWREENEE